MKLGAMSSKGKRRTYLTISLGVLVLLIAGYAAKDAVVESYWLSRLENMPETELAAS